MLTIRREQQEAIGRAVLVTFEVRLAEHVAEHFPGIHASLGERPTKVMVRYAIEKAYSYGFRNGGQVTRYLNLMLTFGRDFDTDDRFPWARRVLTYDAHSTARMNRLYRIGLRRESRGNGFSQEDMEFFIGEAGEDVSLEARSTDSEESSDV